MFPDLNLLYAFSSRIRGNMSLFYGDTADALANRKGFLKEIGVDYRRLVCAKQVHASMVRHVREADTGKGALSYKDAIADTDAFVTDNIGVPLAVFTADCLPVFLYDFRKHAIGLIHAGWRGSKDNISARTAQLMRQEFGTRAQDLYAGFGPAIRECCYEVGEGFADFFPQQALIKRSGRYFLDLAGINKGQLLEEGVKAENIFDSKICTSCRNKEFFSYRKEGPGCGRTMSVMMLK